MDEAIECLEVARQDLTYRQPSKVLNNLGYAYLVSGQQQAAVRSLEEAVARQPNLCSGWYNLGLAYESGDEHARALDAMDHVVMICPEVYPEATLKAGELLLSLGKDAEGEMYLKRVVSNNPGTPLSKRAQEQLNSLALP